MKQIIQLVFLFLFSYTATAQTTIDGMTFIPNVDENGDNDGTCCLCKYEKGPLDIIVPEVVSIGNEEYTVTRIGPSSFCESWDEESGIKTVVLPSSITSIGESAFEYCMKLTKINLPEGLQIIEKNAFNYCQFLTIDRLPSTLKYIGDFAFNANSRLILDNDLTIPASVVYIGKCSFDLYLTSLTFEYSDEEIEIEERAFQSNYYLHYLEINRNLNVKPWALFTEIRTNCNLTIGELVTDISWFNPLKAAGLSQIVCNSVIPPSIGDFSQDQYSKIKLFLPSNLKSIYENNPRWAFFKNIVELEMPLNSFSISSDTKDLILNVGETVEIGYTINPPIDSQVSITQDGFIYSKQVANIWLNDSYGIISGAYPGKTNIAFTLMLNNSKSICHLTVIQPATNIVLNKNEIILEKGESITLYANVAPIDVSDSSVTWTSTNSNVATVKDGVVTAVNGGICQIVATTHNGLTAECTVKVSPILVESIEITPDVLEAEEGECVQLITTVLPESASEKDVEWSSDDASIAEVNNDGLVKIVSSGLTVIRAKAVDGSGIEGICEITGVAGVEIIVAEDENLNLYSIDGMLILKKVTMDQIHQLPPAIYILTNGVRKIKFIKK